MKKLLAFLMIYSLLASASEPATTTALPLPTSGNVTLPLAEYNRLVDLATKSVKTYEQPPVAYTIKRADLKLHVSNDTVVGSMQLDGEVFSRNATKVPLASGMTILNASHQGKALPLFEDGSSSTAVLPGSSDFSVGLETGMPLYIEAGRASFNLPVPAAGSVKLALAIPGDHTEVHISPGLITSRTSSSGQTMLEATLVPNQTATISWATREIVAPVVPREVRFLSDVKTLVSINEADLRVAALCDVTVVQGEPAQFALNVPEGYEITDVSGSTVDGSEIDGTTLTVHLSASAPRTHQFLITMERPLNGAEKLDVPFVSFKDTQRETGELLVEGSGAMELTAKEGGSLKRMDVKEISSYLRALAHTPLQAAFRYHRQPNESPSLALSWTRFPDGPVLAAVAEKAVVTTLVTTEGRSLTEVVLTVKNQAQPFMKVGLPADATILSADVAGEKVKPVQGTDGNRIPLLRANFRPSGAYTVSFVFMHSGTPFAKKGGSDIALPSMDLPISFMEWEVFLPEQYKVKDFGGDAMAMNLLQPVSVVTKSGSNTWRGQTLGPYAGIRENQGLDQMALSVPGVAAGRGSMSGYVVDPQGAVISGAEVKVTDLDRGRVYVGRTDGNGMWTILGVPPARVKIEISAQGFKTAAIRGQVQDAEHGTFWGATKLTVGETSTTVEVTAEAPMVETTQAQVTNTFSTTSINGVGGIGGGAVGGPREKKQKQQPDLQQNVASANVFNLQKKVSGVLPVHIDVPRAGSSYHFARALVLDEETKLTFNYKTR
ncbi:MAG TPA: carboxypeptidase-like regulatory domain-containing protein [Candidatus Limnocylindrales bacterium]|jgi:hypothetical protein|nr:carboxypeptidase-like regulatory domain-containing protein [Candidatus Limnocylindrales bacterium]